MTEANTSCRISFEGIDDSEERDRQTRRVRGDLAELGIAVTMPAQPPPPGARGVDATTIGQLVAALPPTLVALRALVASLHEWTSAGQRRRVVIETAGDRLELGNASADEQHELVTAWIERRQSAT